MLEKLKRHWNSLVVFATALVATVSRFLVAPPAGLDQEAWYKYGIFLTALLIGLWLVPLGAWSKKRFVWRWWILAACLTIASAVCLIQYSSLIGAWTITYFKNNRVVIGSTLTSDAKGYRARLQSEGSPSDDLYLLQQYGGRASDVWEEDEIVRRGHVLTLFYLCALLTLASAAITVSQASYCISADSAEGRPSA